MSTTTQEVLLTLIDDMRQSESLKTSNQEMFQLLKQFCSLNEMSLTEQIGHFFCDVISIVRNEDPTNDVRIHQRFLPESGPRKAHILASLHDEQYQKDLLALLTTQDSSGRYIFPCVAKHPERIQDLIDYCNTHNNDDSLAENYNAGTRALVDDLSQLQAQLSSENVLYGSEEIPQTSTNLEAETEQTNDDSLAENYNAGTGALVDDLRQLQAQVTSENGIYGSEKIPQISTNLEAETEQTNDDSLAENYNAGTRALVDDLRQLQTQVTSENGIYGSEKIPQTSTNLEAETEQTNDDSLAENYNAGTRALVDDLRQLQAQLSSENSLCQSEHSEESSTNLEEQTEEATCCLPGSMMLLGGVIAALGIAAVATALVVLFLFPPVTITTAIAVGIGLGAAAIVGGGITMGVGFFKNRQSKAILYSKDNVSDEESRSEHSL